MESEVAVLRILMVEDSQADTDLIVRQLRELPNAFEHIRVVNEPGLRKALAEFVPDIILSDFSMPGFSGPESLKIAFSLAPGTPFLFVSGTIGEELAIHTLQNGAMDYVLKDSLHRLPLAITRAMEITHTRRERERMEVALRKSEERFRTIVENSNDWIWECDLDTRILYSNSGLFRILGYSPDEVVGSLASELMPPEHHAEFADFILKKIDEAKGWRHLRLLWKHRDGSIRTLESTATPLWDDNGNVIGFRGVDEDITMRLQHEAQIQQLARIQAVLGALGHAVLRATTRDQLLHRMCQVAVEKGGFSSACISELAESGKTLRLNQCFGDSALIEHLNGLGDILISDADTTAQDSVLQAVRERRNFIVRNYALDSDSPAQHRSAMTRLGITSKILLPIGNPPWGVLALYASKPQTFDDDELLLLLRLTDEIDYAIEFIEKSEQLEFLAYNNPITGLPNRTAFLARLQPLISKQPMCIALIDIAHFSAFNESRGREFGENLLREVAKRLQAALLEDTLVAHPEPDAFALAYEPLGDAISEGNRLDTRMRAFCSQPFVVNGEEIRIDLRGGLAISPEHGEDAEKAEHNALAAMMEGTRRGVHVYVFNEELRGRAARRQNLESELTKALENGEFQLHYQPKFDAATLRLAGAEALLRWVHPQRGMISPGDFIALLEDSELIVPVGQWVMGEAIRTALIWREQLPRLRIAVNVSSRELRHSQFIHKCTELLEPHSDDQLVDIEITESLLMEDIERSIEILHSLRELGCEISIDDFGTGYSSLNHLARLPVDMIKIDESFVALMTQSPETMSLVTNIINLARSLSLRTVAEGVEEDEQIKLLRLLRCDQLQGYLLGRPMPADEFIATFTNAAS